MGLIAWLKEKIRMLFKTGKAIGYVQLYFKIVGEKGIYYTAFDGDFGKPISWLRLQSIKLIMKRAYEKFDKIYSAEFCSKEEWKESRCENEISCSWGRLRRSWLELTHTLA